MSHFRESNAGRCRLRSIPSLVLTALSLLSLSTLIQPQAAHAEALWQQEAEDTTRVPRFRKTVVPNTEFLARAVEAAAARRSLARLTTTAEIPIEIELPDEEQAKQYASRYRISSELARQIISTARAEGIDPDLAFRLVRVESHFKARARGPMGALGLAQLMPATARSIDRSVRTEADILDPATNLRLGFRYLRRMIERYDGDVRLGLLAYNRGETAVDRALRNGRDPENGYSHRVLGTRSSNPYRGKGLLR